MSESTPDKPPIDPETKPKEPAASTAVAAVKTSRARKWARRFRLTFFAILLLFAIFRIALQFMLPTVLRRTAAAYGLSANYERHEMDLFGGDVGLWHLVLAPLGGGEALLIADYCRGDVSTWDLLRGHLVVRRLEAEGINLLVERNAKGEIALLKKITGTLASSTPAVAPASSSKATSPKAAAPTVVQTATPKAVVAADIDLSAPFQLDAFRLDRVHAHVRDLSVSPPVDATLELNLRLTDLRSPTRPSGFDLEMSAQPVLESLRAKGVGRSSGKTLDAKMEVVISGLHPMPAAGYLRLLGLKPVARDLSMRLNWDVKTSATTRPGALAAAMNIGGISVIADGREVAGLDTIHIDVNAIGAAFADITKVIIESGHCSVERSATGGFQLAGLELLPAFTASPATAPSVSPVLPTASKNAAPAVSVPVAPTASIPPAATAFLWNIAEIQLHHLQAGAIDRFVSPTADLAISLDELTLKHLSNDPGQSKNPVDFSTSLLAPGIARSIHLAGRASRSANPQTANLTVQIDGFKPDALRPYLDAAGLECLVKDGSIQCAVEATATPDSVDATVKDLRFADGRELLTLSDVHLTGLDTGTKDSGMRIATIEITGPAFNARRDAAGMFEAMGFRTKPTRPARAALPLSATASIDSGSTALPAPVPVFVVPKLAIGHFMWKDIRIAYEDQNVIPPTSIALKDAGIDITDLKLGDGTAANPAKIKAWFSAPGLAEHLLLAGTLASQPEGSTLELDVTGDGLTGEHIGTYLKSTGIEPILKDGSLKLHLNASMLNKPDGSSAPFLAMSLTDMELKDAGGELIGVDRLTVNGVDLGNSATVANTINIDKPRVHVTREKNGTFSIAGFRTILAPPPTPPGNSPMPLASSTPPAVSPNPNPVPASAPATIPASIPTSMPVPAVTLLKLLKVTDAELKWTDNVPVSPVQLAASVNVDVSDFVYGRNADPAKINLVAKVEGCLNRLAISGRVSPSTIAPEAQLDITADGVQAGALAAYIPPTLKSTLKDGRFKANLDAGLSPNPKGGHQGRLIVTNLDYRDGANSPALMHIDAANVRVNRYDPVGKIISIGEISLNGLDANIQKTPRGMNLLGLQTGIAVPPIPGAAAAHAEIAVPVAAANAPVEASGKAVVAPTTPQDIARMVSASRLDLPLITLEKLNLGIRRLALTDTARPTAAPLVLNNLELKNRNRIEMLGNDAENRPPINIELKCQPQPLADSFTLNASASPFALRPNLKIDLAATGIKGDRLLTAFPEYKSQIDGSTLTDGRLKGEVRAEVKMDRRDLLRLDFTRPFDAEFSVKKLEFRNADGPVLAGLEEIHSKGIHVEPKTGGVHAKSLEVTNLIASIVREKDGIHALGMVLRAPATQPASAQIASTKQFGATQAAVAPGTIPASQPAVVVAVAPTSRPAGEIKLDALIVSGLNFRIEDRTVDPPLVVPITSMDLEARDLSNYLLYDADKSMRFSLLLNAGKISLPKPLKKSGIAGALSDLAEGDKAKQEAIETEEREIFSQLTASGKLSLFPSPKGWIKTSLSGLELGALNGEAKQAGFGLSAGTFDADIDARFLTDGTLDVRPKFTFTDLGIADPPKGPVERYLHLPAPLDGIIAILQDASGQIAVPLRFTVNQGKINTGDIAASASGAFLEIVVKAIASSPLKAVGSVASLIGFDLKDKKKYPPPPLSIGFEPAATAYLYTEGGLPMTLLERLKNDPTVQITLRHDLGAGDVKRAAERANPNGDDAQALAYQLRQKKMELLKERARITGQARGEIGSGIEVTQTLDHLRGVERELAATEDGLDDLNNLVRPGAGRQALRRTRAACIAIGEQRLTDIYEILLATGIPKIAERITITHAKFNPDDSLDGGAVTMTMSLKGK